MIVPRQELFAVIQRYNPWWDGRPDVELPKWRRHAFGELILWLSEPPSKRAVLVSGARQVGKTTLLRQAAYELIDQGVAPESILYATFDSPILKLVGLEGLIDAWEEMRPPSVKADYLLLDEIQYSRDWQTWLKHQVDFVPKRRIAVTGSAIPIASENPESGVGRWHTIKLATLSFFEYLQIKQIESPRIPAVKSLAKLFEWQEIQRVRASTSAKPLVSHFHEYLLRGGFPETAKVQSILAAQKLLREDIVDKVLKRDMTAQFGTRSILELEKTFLYLCLHDGGILDMAALCSNLEVGKPTVNNFLSLFEAAHLVYRLTPFGYGKEVLRGKPKFYLADAAISSSVLLKGRSLLEDSAKLGAAVETAFFKHVFTRFYPQTIRFSYWRSKTKKGLEVDIVAETPTTLVPFEVKYSQSRVGAGEVKGLIEFCKQKKVKRAYVITRELNDFERLTGHDAETDIMKIPAPLACYWLSQSEIQS
jgi:predicted AAA+ superfamily ATPase